MEFEGIAHGLFCAGLLVALPAGFWLTNARCLSLPSYSPGGISSPHTE